ncbi:hypothetical protein PMAYCL1PPCAC_32468, partial [Pristionchus mayeri]
MSLASDEEPSPLAKMSARDEELLRQYYEKLARISYDLEQEGGSRQETDGHCFQKPPENVIETVQPYIEDKKIDPKKVKRIFRCINEMTVDEMRAELKEIHKSPHGSSRDLRVRLREFYRKEYALLCQRRDDTRSRMRNLKKFRYLVAIDIEATCEERINDIDYQHEIFELPAVLIDCNTFNIIDKFRTYVRPEINPKLSEFCVKFCHTHQANVDDAPLFPEAWARLIEWMSRHGIMGDEKHASFAIVTDGPNDVQHFLQRSFLQYNMRIPHEFRHWINVKWTFENQKGKDWRITTKGDGTSSIVRMCEKLGIEMDGAAHEGLSDALNVAKIACHLVLQRKIPLFINQRLVRVRGRPLCLPGPATEADLRGNLSWRNRYDQAKGPNLFSFCLMFKLYFEWKKVTQEDFITGAYWDCESCDE